MIMSFWPTSLQVMENKKNGESEHKAEQIQRDEDGGISRAKQKENKNMYPWKSKEITEEQGEKAKMLVCTWVSLGVVDTLSLLLPSSFCCFFILTKSEILIWHLKSEEKHSAKQQNRLSGWLWLQLQWVRIPKVLFFEGCVQGLQ